MPTLPLFRPRDVVRAFERLGWQVARQRGSHIVLTKQGALVTLSVPDHPQVARGIETDAVLSKRIKDNQPLPGSEAAVRKLIADLQAGKPDEDMFAPGGHPFLAQLQ